MAKPLLSPLAEDDLVEIWHFIAEDNAGAADRFLDRLGEACRLLADQPGLGRARAELAPGLRSFPVGRYVIFYRPAAGSVEIARVLSAYRDIDPTFFADEPDPSS